MEFTLDNETPLAPLSLTKNPKSDKKDETGRVFGFGFTNDDIIKNLQEKKKRTCLGRSTKMEQRKLAKHELKFSDCQELQKYYKHPTTDPVRIKKLWLQK